MTKRSRRGTPRLLRVTSVAVARLPRWRRHVGEDLADVTMLTFDGSWEHGQRQEVRVPLPTIDAPRLARDLLDAVATPLATVDVGQASPPARADVPPAAASSVTSGVAAGAGTVAGGASVSRPAPSRPGPDRRAVLLRLLEDHLDLHFGDAHRARAAFLSAGLRKAEVSSMQDLPIAALAALVNQLLAAPPSRFTPQGDAHDHTDTVDP